MGKVMVTGALGNVGGYVAKHLITNKQDVLVADINVEALQKKYGESAEAVFFDFTDNATFVHALREADRVFIMRPPHLGKPEDLKPFVEALKAHGGVKLVSFLSLIGVENNPFPPHHKIEKYIEQAGLSFCHIRPNFFMQNISGVHAFEIKHFNRIVVPVKKAQIGFTDAEDVGEIAAKVLSEPGKHRNTKYPVTGPEAIDYYEAARILSEELGRNIMYANPKPSLAKRYWIDIRGLDAEFSTVMNRLYMMTRMGGAKKVTAVFEEVMGKKPQTFRQFVKKNLSSWQ
jgi:uncharacterized protein YbjT (DUF2867 family)